jgi:stage V sporulation protein G
MNITEVRVKLVSDEGERLRAFCSLTFDGEFVIRDIKVIDGTNGPFVAMPSRKLADKCRKCGCKNHLRARFCNECGAKLNEQRAGRDAGGRVKLHADVAHPITPACREQVQNAVIAAYRAEVERAQQPGYQPTALEEETEEARYDGSEYDSLVAELRQSASRRAEPGEERSGTREPSRPQQVGEGEPEPHLARIEQWSDASEAVPTLVPGSTPKESPRAPSGEEDAFSAGLD